MKIQPIVEGHGEVPAVPVLLRRLRNESQNYTFDVNRPIRRKRGSLVKEQELRRAIQLAKLQQDCRAILVLLDSDDDCPKNLGPLLQAWAQDEAGDIPCAVVLPNREYEAWFLSSIESLRGVRGIESAATSHPDPEQPRDAAGELERRMLKGRSYSKTADQAALSEKFDMSMAYRRCRSFRKLTKAFGDLVNGMGIVLAVWPPPSWVNVQPTPRSDSTTSV